MASKILAVAALAGSAMAFQAPEHADISVVNTVNQEFRSESGLLDRTMYRGMNMETIGRMTVQAQIGKVDLVLKDTVYTKHNGMTHLYYNQLVNGIEIADTVVTVNINKDSQVVSMNTNGLDEASVSRQTASLMRQRATVQPLDAVKAFLAHADLYHGEVTPTDSAASLNGDTHTFTFGSENRMSEALSVPEQTVEARLVYAVDANQELQLSWAVNVESEKPHYAMYQAYMSATDAARTAPVAVHDLVKWFAEDGQYQAYSIPGIDPLMGPNGPRGSPGAERTTEPELYDADYSPLGWHGTSATQRTSTTIGNNVIAQENHDGTASYINNYRPSPAGDTNDYTYPIDFSIQPQQYVDAAVSNLFWWNNMFHDLMYIYGWDEVAGNMQDTNFNRGGAQNDALQVNAQDGAGFNNANQATPADGGRGRQRMYLWNWSNPLTDGDLDSGIIIHEYAHSLSNRLTGGPSRANCLGNGQSGGMGEGWGDTLAAFFQQTEDTPSDSQINMGEYAAGRGIRQYPYSTDMRVNPDTHNDVGQGGPYNRVHAVGAVWANTLMEIYWDMKARFGFEADWLNSTSRAGNVMLLQNIIDGMKMQPCTPTLIQARDAIMMADDVNYGGENKCTMWNGFAKRGLGVDATTSGTGFGVTTNGFQVPAECN